MLASTTVASTHPHPRLRAAIGDPLFQEELAVGTRPWSGIAGDLVETAFDTDSSTTLLANFFAFGLADGAAVSVRVTFEDDAGTVDTQIFAGFHWDAVTGIAGLLKLAGGGGGHDPMLDTILAAVQHTLPR